MTTEPLNCERVRERLDAWIDGELPADDDARLRSHVKTCPECRDRADERREETIARLRAFQPHRAAAARIGERVIAALSDAPAGDVARSSVPLAGRTTGTTKARRHRNILVSIASSAGLVAAGFLAALLVFPPSINVPDGVRETFEDPAAPIVPVARLTLTTGSVDVRDAATSDWRSISPGEQIALAAPSSVRTPPGVRCELTTTDGSMIRLDGDSNVTMRSSRSIAISAGEVWCSSPPGVQLEVESIPPNSVSIPSSESQNDERVAAWTLSCPPSTSCLASVRGGAPIQVAVADGEAMLTTPHGPERLGAGDTATIAEGEVSRRSASRDELLRQSAWLNPLLAMKGSSDPDFRQRVDELLAHVGQTKLSYLHEQELRGLGEHAVPPLLSYLKSPLSTESDDALSRRAAAARIVADFASTAAIPDLIVLLDDDDAPVRTNAARALERLSGGESFDCSTQDWMDGAPACDEARRRWRDWWHEHQSRVVPRFD